MSTATSLPVALEQISAAPTSAALSPAPRPPLKPLDAALAELLAHAQPLGRTETVSTFHADHRVLAQDLVSAIDVPAFDNSAMDGYALRTADWPGPTGVLPLHQRIAAGQTGQSLPSGAAARIFTGAPVPEGADAVVMQENCDALALPAGELGATGHSASLPAVRVRVQPQLGQCIRRRGEDIAAGATVLRHGDRLTPASLGLAASMGLAELQVAAPVRVALFSTGDELLMPGEVAPADMPPGAIYNSNRFFLRALLMRAGCVVTDCGIVPDRFDATVAALQSASENHDLVLTSGGVSVGEEDHIKPAVQALGELQLWQIAIKPGKPFAYGKVGRAHFIGLPGNPVASWVTFLLLARPFLLKLQGVREPGIQALQLPAHFDWPKADKRREFLRVRLNAAGGLDLFAQQGSGVLTSAVWGDGLVDNPPGQRISHGDSVAFLPLSSLMA